MKNLDRSRRELGLWLKEKREEAGLSLSQLGVIIGHPSAYIARYESGHRLDILDYLVITKALKANPYEVIRVVAKHTHVIRETVPSDYSTRKRNCRSGVRAIS